MYQGFVVNFIADSLLDTLLSETYAHGIKAGQNTYDSCYFDKNNDFFYLLPVFKYRIRQTHTILFVSKNMPVKAIVFFRVIKVN